MEERGTGPTKKRRKTMKRADAKKAAKQMIRVAMENVWDYRDENNTVAKMSKEDRKTVYTELALQVVSIKKAKGLY